MGMKLIYLVLALVSLNQAGAQTNSELGKDRFVEVGGGVTIHCLEKGEGPTLLFVPGWTMPAEIWEYQIRHFSHHYHVVAMDPRCQGSSTITTNGLNPLARAGDIKAVVERLKLGPAVLIGWSMGVAEAAAYVDQFGTKGISAMVLVDGMAGFSLPPGTDPEEMQFLKQLREDQSQFVDKFVRGMYRQPQSEEYLKRVIAAALKTPAASASALMVSVFKQDRRAVLKRIDVPTLLAMSTIPQATREELQKSIKNSKLEVFDQAGHALFVDHAARFNQVLEAFLKTNHIGK